MFQVGNVKFAAMVASGTAVVTFRDPQSALTAIDLDWSMSGPYSTLNVVADTESGL